MSIGLEKISTSKRRILIIKSFFFVLNLYSDIVDIGGWVWAVTWLSHVAACLGIVLIALLSFYSWPLF